MFAAPAYRWADTPAPLQWLRDWWHRLGDWLEGLRAGNPAAFRILALALLVALVLILAHGAWVVWRTVRHGAGPERGDARPAEREARDAAWYLREADRAAGVGRMREALQLAFVGLALTLDAPGPAPLRREQDPRRVRPGGAPGGRGWRPTRRARTRALRPRLRRPPHRARRLPAVAGRSRPAVACARALSWRSRAALFITLAVIAGIAGSRRARLTDADRRRSTLLAGPAGARGWSEALARLGVRVERFRRPPAAFDTLAPARTLVAFLGPSSALTPREGVTVARLHADLLLAGPGANAAIRCFGYDVRPHWRDGLALVAPPGAEGRPFPLAVAELVRRAGTVTVDSTDAEDAGPVSCTTPDAARVDTLLRSAGGRAVVLRGVARRRPDRNAGGRRSPVRQSDRCARPPRGRSRWGWSCRGTTGSWWTSIITGSTRRAAWRARRSRGCWVRRGAGACSSSPAWACWRCSPPASGSGPSARASSAAAARRWSTCARWRRRSPRPGDTTSRSASSCRDSAAGSRAPAGCRAAELAPWLAGLGPPSGRRAGARRWTASPPSPARSASADDVRHAADAVETLWEELTPT